MGKKLLNIFLTTLKLGAFTFGGGYAMIPLMQREFVEKNGWIDSQDIVDIFAVAQSIPGVIAINSSVMLAYRVAGLPGALVAAAGISLPSLILLSLVTLVYRQVIENTWVQAAMRGVRAGVVALILSAVLRMGKSAIQDVLQWALFAAGLVLLILFPSVSAILVIIASGLIGFLFSLYKNRKRPDGADKGGAS